MTHDEAPGSANPWPATVLAVCWLAASFWLSSQPSPHLSNEPLVDLLLKKSGHFAGYALFAVLAALALGAWRGRSGAAARLVARVGSESRTAVALATGWAISDELHQVFTVSRTPLVTDVLIDAAGAVAGVWLLGRLRRR